MTPYRPQSEAKKGLKMGFRSIPGALLFYFIFRTTIVKGLLRKKFSISKPAVLEKMGLKVNE